MLHKSNIYHFQHDVERTAPKIFQIADNQLYTVRCIHQPAFGEINRNIKNPKIFESRLRKVSALLIQAAMLAEYFLRNPY